MTRRPYSLPTLPNSKTPVIDLKNWAALAAVVVGIGATLSSGHLAYAQEKTNPGAISQSDPSGALRKMNDLNEFTVSLGADRKSVIPSIGAIGTAIQRRVYARNELAAGVKIPSGGASLMGDFGFTVAPFAPQDNDSNDQLAFSVRLKGNLDRNSTFFTQAGAGFYTIDRSRFSAITGGVRVETQNLDPGVWTNANIRRTRVFANLAVGNANYLVDLTCGMTASSRGTSELSSTVSNGINNQTFTVKREGSVGAHSGFCGAYGDLKLKRGIAGFADVLIDPRAESVNTRRLTGGLGTTENLNSARVGFRITLPRSQSSK